MTYPFLRKFGGRPALCLNAELYPASLIERVKKEEPDAVRVLGRKNKYLFLELDAAGRQETLDFLNFLIYHNKLK